MEFGRGAEYIAAHVVERDEHRQRLVVCTGHAQAGAMEVASPVSDKRIV